MSKNSISGLQLTFSAAFSVRFQYYSKMGFAFLGMRLLIVVFSKNEKEEKSSCLSPEHPDSL
jgi:hypothetical protein